MFASSAPEVGANAVGDHTSPSFDACRTGGGSTSKWRRGGIAAGKAFRDMLGVFAEFETNLRRERQLEGIAAAKARGVYKGRKPVIDVNVVRRLTRQGVGATEIALRMGIRRASVYRLGSRDAA